MCTLEYFNLFSGKNIFKAYKPLIINKKNMNFAYLCCMSSNSVTMPSKLLPISTEHGEMGIQVIGQYEGASRNSVV